MFREIWSQKSSPLEQGGALRGWSELELQCYLSISANYNDNFNVRFVLFFAPAFPRLRHPSPPVGEGLGGEGSVTIFGNHH